jgi:hypothetical protein
VGYSEHREISNTHTVNAILKEIAKTGVGDIASM